MNYDEAGREAAEALLEREAFCQRLVAFAQACGKPTPCADHPEPTWDARWSMDVGSEVRR